MALSKKLGVLMALWGFAICTPKPPLLKHRISGEAVGSQFQETSKPSSEAVGDRVLQIESDWSHVCARLESGRVACWGSNDHGQLGDGTILPSQVPVLVGGLENVEQLLSNAMCARTQTSEILCWGEEQPCSNCEKVPHTMLWRVPEAIWASRAFEGLGTSCFVNPTGFLQCLRSEDQPPAGMPKLRAVHQGQAFICGEKVEGGLVCYWRGQSGQTVLFEPPLPSAVKEIAAGAFHLCVLDHTNKVHCWGDRIRSGYGTPDPNQPKHEYGPPLTLEGSQIRGLAAGLNHTCMLMEKDLIRCWGRMSHRQTKEPQQRQFEFALPGITQLAIGGDTACGLIANEGSVYCWGLTSEAENLETPTRVKGLPMQKEPIDPPPRTTAQELRQALLWADSPWRLGQIADLNQGLVFAKIRGGTQPITKTACFVEHLAKETFDLPQRVRGTWTCDRELQRCIAQRSSDATAFYWSPLQGSGRKLLMVVDGDRHLPTEEPAKVLTKLRNPQAGCELWQAVRNHDEALVGEVLTVLHHPANSLGDKTPPTFTHVCREEAQQFAHQHLGVSPMVNDWRCEGLRCSYNLGQWARGVLVFRQDDSGQPKLWVVGDDFDGDFDMDGPPLLKEAIRRAKRHKCL